MNASDAARHHLQSFRASLVLSSTSDSGYRLAVGDPAPGYLPLLDDCPIYAAPELAAVLEASELLFRDNRLVMRTPQVYPFGPILTDVTSGPVT